VPVPALLTSLISTVLGFAISQRPHRLKVQLAGT
jgi:hypothetical protein